MRKAIQYDLAQLDLGVPVLSSGPRGVRWTAQPRQERELTSYDNKGTPRYSNRHWIEITNSGDVDATDVVFESVGDNSSMMLIGHDAPTVIHAGQTRRLNVDHHMGGGDPNILRIRWTEDRAEQKKDFHVG